MGLVQRLLERRLGLGMEQLELRLEQLRLEQLELLAKLMLGMGLESALVGFVMVLGPILGLVHLRVGSHDNLRGLRGGLLVSG